jgi:hypothetical protein
VVVFAERAAQVAGIRMLGDGVVGVGGVAVPERAEPADDGRGDNLPVVVGQAEIGIDGDAVIGVPAW